MTYRKIFDLKFKKKISTLELQKTFPGECRKVSQVALAELPAKTLKQILRGGEKLEQVLLLKKSLDVRKKGQI